MIALLTSFTLLVSVAGLVVYYNNKNKQRKKDLYPLQLKVLSELLSDIRNNKLSLYVLQGNKRKAIGYMTLSDAGKSLDNEEEFSKEEYDDHRLFFAEGVEPLPGLSKYIGNGILPKDIRSELRDFQNTKFEKAKIGNTPCFVMAPQGQQILNEEMLLEGNAEAFESWLTFKERANNIEFIIEQWVQENSYTEKPIVGTKTQRTEMA